MSARAEVVPITAPGGVSAAHGALVVGVGAATGLAVVAGNGNPLLALAPVVMASGAWILARAPLRWSASVLLLLLLAVDDTGETYGHWRTPLAVLGDMMQGRLDEVVHLPGLAVTGMELFLAFLLVVRIHRRITGESVDDVGQVRAAGVLRDFLVLYVAGVLFSEMLGLARGLPLAPWKLRNLLHPILLALLFLAAYRGPRDHALLGRLVVLSACVRAVLAVIVQRIAIQETGGKWATATSHGDSILFAVATLIVAADLLERPDRRRLLRAALVLPILLVGALENGRRIVWVMIGLTVVFVYLVSPMRRWKRSVTRVLLVIGPVLLLYFAVGWNRGGRIFGPVQTARSLVDTSRDRSAYWREVEMFNIALSMRVRPLLGLGLGGEYSEFMPNDNIADAYPEYRQWPHNTVLGLLLLMGLFAFTATWVLLPLVVFFSVRSFRMAADPEHRVAAIGCLGAVIACLVMAYGDTGAHYPQYKVLAALAIAVSAKLAVATGAWSARAPLGERYPTSSSRKRSNPAPMAVQE